MPSSLGFRRTIAAVGLVACTVLTLAACSGASARTSSGDAQGFVSGDGSAVVIDPADRVTAPEVEGVTLQGDSLSLSDFAGDVVVLNVWGSWCAPCRAEAADTARGRGQDGSRRECSSSESTPGTRRPPHWRSNVTSESRIQALSTPTGSCSWRSVTACRPAAIPSTLDHRPEGRVAARVLGATTYLS